MKTKQILLPAAIAAATLILFSATSASAWSGGPFKAGPGAIKNFDGTYKASVVGKNLVGVLIMANTESAGSGTASIFYDGILYTGASVIAIEPASNSVAGTFGGTGSLTGTSSNTDGSSQSTSSNGTTTVNDTTTVNNTTTVNGTTTTNGSTTNSTASSSNNASSSSIASSSTNSTYSVSGSLAGAFMGSIKGRGGYSLVFSGKGSASVAAQGSQGGSTGFKSVPIRVSGSRTTTSL